MTNCRYLFEPVSDVLVCRKDGKGSRIARQLAEMQKVSNQQVINILAHKSSGWFNKPASDVYIWHVNVREHRLAVVWNKHQSENKCCPNTTCCWKISCFWFLYPNFMKWKSCTPTLSESLISATLRARNVPWTPLPESNDTQSVNEMVMLAPCTISRSSLTDEWFKYATLTFIVPETIHKSAMSWELLYWAGLKHEGCAHWQIEMHAGLNSLAVWYFCVNNILCRQYLGMKQTRGKVPTGLSSGWHRFFTFWALQTLCVGVCKQSFRQVNWWKCWKVQGCVGLRSETTVLDNFDRWGTEKCVECAAMLGSSKGSFSFVEIPSQWPFWHNTRCCVLQTLGTVLKHNPGVTNFHMKYDVHVSNFPRYDMQA